MNKIISINRIVSSKIYITLKYEVEDKTILLVASSMEKVKHINELKNTSGKTHFTTFDHHLSLILFHKDELFIIIYLLFHIYIPCCVSIYWLLMY